jgi:hypothetical protein
LEYQGDYFFSDARVGFLRRLKWDGAAWTTAPPVPDQPSASDWGAGFQSIADLVTGPDGALWYCYTGDGGANGEVGRIYYSATLTSVAERVPEAVFSPPHPSPARGHVGLTYQLARRARVELAIYDACGRRIRVLVSAAASESGRYTVGWDGRSDDGRRVPPGLYLARLTVDGAVHSRRLSMLR